MRLIALAAVPWLACGHVEAPNDRENVTDSALDGGAMVDAGAIPFACDAGTSFCALGGIWSCTYTGRDAVLTDVCSRKLTGLDDGGSFVTAHVQGACSETSCPSGFTEFSDVNSEPGGVVCCVPAP